MTHFLGHGTNVKFLQKGLQQIIAGGFVAHLTRRTSGCGVMNITDLSLVLINARKGLLLVEIIRNLNNATASIQ